MCSFVTLYSVQMKLRTSILVILSLFLTDLAAGQSFNLSASIGRGKSIYSNACASCHMVNGTGIPWVYSPLVGVDSLLNDKSRLVKSILQGVQGPIEINGVTYNGNMQSYPLTDQEVSNVLNYIRNSWGKKREAILPNEIQSLVPGKSNDH